MNNRSRYHGGQYHGRQVDGAKLLKKIVPNVEKAYKRAKVGLMVSFILFIPTFGLTMPFFIIFGFKQGYLHILGNAVCEIKVQDKMKIDDLMLCQQIGKNMSIAVINKLIETGNLPDYEVIGNVGVAKKTLGLSESDFAVSAVQTAVAQPGPKKCLNCGSSVTSASGKFCEYCGGKL